MTASPIDYDEIQELQGTRAAMVMRVLVEELKGVSRGQKPIYNIIYQKNNKWGTSLTCQSINALVRDGYIQRERHGSHQIYSVKGHYTSRAMQMARAKQGVIEKRKQDLGPTDIDGVHICCYHSGCAYAGQCCGCKKKMLGKGR